MGFLERFERAVAANREEPLGEMSLDRLLLLVVQTHECLLHDVAGTIEILDDAQRVLKKRAFEPLESAKDPGGFFLLFVSEHGVLDSSLEVSK